METEKMNKKTIYIGTFIHCKSLEELEICTGPAAIGVDERGMISFIDRSAPLLSLSSLSLSLSSPSVRVQPEHGNTHRRHQDRDKTISGKKDDNRDGEDGVDVGGEEDTDRKEGDHDSGASVDVDVDVPVLAKRHGWTGLEYHVVRARRRGRRRKKRQQFFFPGFVGKEGFYPFPYLFFSIRCLASPTTRLEFPWHTLHSRSISILVPLLSQSMLLLCPLFLRLASTNWYHSNSVGEINLLLPRTCPCTSQVSHGCTPFPLVRRCYYG